MEHMLLPFLPQCHSTFLRPLLPCLHVCIHSCQGPCQMSLSSTLSWDQPRSAVITRACYTLAAPSSLTQLELLMRVGALLVTQPGITFKGLGKCLQQMALSLASSFLGGGMWCDMLAICSSWSRHPSLTNPGLLLLGQLTLCTSSGVSPGWDVMSSVCPSSNSVHTAGAHCSCLASALGISSRTEWLVCSVETTRKRRCV